MVFRRTSKPNSDQDSASDLSPVSSNDDLDFLIDDFLDKLSVFEPVSRGMTIKNINRKDRSKHERTDRSNELESAGTSKENNYNFGVQGYNFVPNDERNSSVRAHRLPWSHSTSSGPSLTSEAFSFSSESQRRLRPSFKRHRPTNIDQSKKCCDRIEERFSGDDVTGNNSEDEYYHVSDGTPQTSSKIGDNGLEQLLKEKKGWKVVHMRADGACLFRSVSHQVFGDEEKHEIIRKQVVDYMVKNREHFSQYVTEDFDRYLQRKKQPTCHGNHLEIQAISELYNRPVEIYYSSVVPINVFHAEYSHELPIRLGYYGRTHYNSIIDPHKPSFGHGLGMPNYQPGLPEKDLVMQAMKDSESSELEEAMLRDKLAETETKQLEECIAGHILRESYFEHMKSRYDTSTGNQKSSTTADVKPNSSSFGSDFAQTSGACTSGCGKHTSSSIAEASTSASAATAIATTSSSFSSAAATSTNHSNSVVTRYIPEDMLEMNEDEVLALVLEQSRNDYLASLRQSKITGKGVATAYFCASEAHTGGNGESVSASVSEYPHSK